MSIEKTKTWVDLGSFGRLCFFVGIKAIPMGKR